MKKYAITVVVAVVAWVLLLSVMAVPLAASAQLTVPLTVNTQYADGASLTGMWTVLQRDGVTVATGFSPVTFNLVSGASYTISVGDYNGSNFYQWDNGSSSRVRSISIASSTTVTALYISSAHPPPSGSVQLTVNSQFANGNPLSGYYTVLQQSGSTVASGFTPATFTLNSNQSYTVSVSDFGGTTFYQWDNGSTTRARLITLTSPMAITALYINDSNPPPSSPPSSGEASLTVNTQYANGNPLSGMYTTLRQGGATGTIIGTGFSPVTFGLATGTQYTVTTSDYQTNTFHMWDNGSTSRARSLTISADTTITSQYISPSNPAPGAGPPTAEPVSTTVSENSKTGVAITLQGSEPQNRPLTYYPVTQPVKGALSLADGNVITYTPYDWRDGPDSFQYVAHNGIEASQPATVSIDISNTGSKTTSRIIVITVFEDGRSHTGAFTTLSQGGTVINSGFSHMDFDVNNGQSYTVTMTSGSNIFVRWLDTGSSNPSRQVNISQDTAIIAVYRPS